MQGCGDVVPTPCGGTAAVVCLGCYVDCSMFSLNEGISARTKGNYKPLDGCD